MLPCCSDQLGISKGLISSPPSDTRRCFQRAAIRRKQIVHSTEFAHLVNDMSYCKRVLANRIPPISQRSEKITLPQGLLDAACIYVDSFWRVLPSGSQASFMARDRQPWSHSAVLRF